MARVYVMIITFITTIATVFIPQRVAAVQSGYTLKLGLPVSFLYQQQSKIQGYTEWVRLLSPLENPTVFNWNAFLADFLILGLILWGFISIGKYILKKL